MQKDALNNVHITDEQVLMTPEQLKAAFPLSLQQEAQIADSRRTISDIIAGRDPRLLVVCGPCSIHETVPQSSQAWHGSRHGSFRKPVP